MYYNYIVFKSNPLLKLNYHIIHLQNYFIFDLRVIRNSKYLSKSLMSRADHIACSDEYRWTWGYKSSKGRPPTRRINDLKINSNWMETVQKRLETSGDAYILLWWSQDDDVQNACLISFLEWYIRTRSSI